MEGHYLYWLAAFYITVWVITTIACILAKDEDAFIKGVFLGILFIPHQDNYFWLNPENMFAYHFCVIMAMFVGLNKVKHGLQIILITFFLYICDAIWWYYMPTISFPPRPWAFPYDIFYWQSILNITLLILSLMIMKGCYDTHKRRRLEKRIRELDAEDNIGTLDRSSRDPERLGV